MAAQQFQNILLCGQGTSEGRLDVKQDSISWHSKANDKTITMPSSHIVAASFVDMGRSCQLWISEKNGDLLRFEGFRPSDNQRLADLVKGNFAVELDKADLASRGRNWGTIKVRGRNIELLDEDRKLIAPIPLVQIAQAALPGKGELELQFFDDDTVDREDETLVEMRLYLPPEHDLENLEDGRAKAKARRADIKRAREASSGGGGSAGENTDADSGGEGEPDAAASLHALITDAAGIANVSGEALVELNEQIGQFLVPRGRYAIELYPTFMRLIGKTYEFKVTYKSIARMFYLPRPSTSGGEATRFNFVISLDDPVRHGNQRHPHLVMQLERVPIEVALHIPEEDVKAKKYEGLGAAASTLVGDLPKVVAQIFKQITGKQVFKPGSFESAGRHKAVTASVKSNSGLLFPLDKSFLFIHKPAMYIRYSEVDSVEIRRFTGTGVATSKTIDVVVNCKAMAGEPSREYVFNLIDKMERDPLVKFLTQQKVKIIEKTGPPTGGALSHAFTGAEDADDDGEGKQGHDDEEEDESEDEDFEGGSESDESDDEGGEDEDDSDAGYSKKKKKGRTEKSSHARTSSSKSKPKKKKQRRSRKHSNAEGSGGSGSDE